MSVSNDVMCDYVVVSDVHLGNPKLDATLVYARLRKYFFPRLMQCKGLFIAGDFFDRLLSFEDASAYIATKIIQDIIDLAHEHKFFIRVLRGTFSHDRNQCKIFDVLPQNKEVDFKYVQDLELEYMKDEDLYVLYLPDNLPFKTSTDVMTQVKYLMEQGGVTKLDLVIGHGYFTYTLPEVLLNRTPSAYTEAMFDSIVDGFVVMGHVHTPSTSGKVAYCGSFDRLAHGEEHPKGFLTLTRHPWRCTFVENKEATPFVTIDCTKYTTSELDDMMEYLRSEKTKKFNGTVFGHLRVLVKDMAMKVAVLHSINLVFPDCKCTVKPMDTSYDTANIPSFSDITGHLAMMEVSGIGMSSGKVLPEDIVDYLILKQRPMVFKDVTEVKNLIVQLE